jgi:hypothetical protein
MCEFLKPSPIVVLVKMEEVHGMLWRGSQSHLSEPLRSLVLPAYQCAPSIPFHYCEPSTYLYHDLAHTVPSPKVTATSWITGGIIASSFPFRQHRSFSSFSSQHLTHIVASFLNSNSNNNGSDYSNYDNDIIAPFENKFTIQRVLFGARARRGAFRSTLEGRATVKSHLTRGCLNFGGMGNSNHCLFNMVVVWMVVKAQWCSIWGSVGV